MGFFESYMSRQSTPPGEANPSEVPGGSPTPSAGPPLVNPPAPSVNGPDGRPPNPGGGPPLPVYIPPTGPFSGERIPAYGPFYSDNFGNTVPPPPVQRPPSPQQNQGPQPVQPAATRPGGPQQHPQPRQPVAPPPSPSGSPFNPSSGGAPGVGAGASMGTAMPFSLQLDHIPSAVERASLPPGMPITTPYGTVDSQGNLSPSPEGAQRYQQAVITARKTFGPHPWADDPQAPPPPVKLGRPNFNPFTGSWTR